MTNTEIIDMWKKGYSKNNIIEIHANNLIHKIRTRNYLVMQKKIKSKDIKKQAQEEVEQTLLAWWKKEVESQE